MLEFHCAISASREANVTRSKHSCFKPPSARVLKWPNVNQRTPHELQIQQNTHIEKQDIPHTSLRMSPCKSDILFQLLRPSNLNPRTEPPSLQSTVNQLPIKLLQILDVVPQLVRLLTLLPKHLKTRLELAPDLFDFLL